MFLSKILVFPALIFYSASQTQAFAQVPFAFFKAQGCSSTPKWEQNREVSTSSNSTTLSTGGFTLAVKAGSLMVCQIDNQSTAVAASSVTDTQGNTWAKAAGPAVIGGWRSETWYAQNIAAAPMNITVTFPSAQNIILNCHEFSGVATSGALDQVASGTGNSASVTLGPLTGSSYGQLYYSYFGPITGLLTPGAGWTSRSTYLNNLIQTRVVGAPAATSATATLSGGDWYGTLVTFRCKQ